MGKKRNKRGPSVSCASNPDSEGFNNSSQGAGSQDEDAQSWEEDEIEQSTDQVAEFDSHQESHFQPSGSNQHIHSASGSHSSSLIAAKDGTSPNIHKQAGQSAFAQSKASQAPRSQAKAPQPSASQNSATFTTVNKSATISSMGSTQAMASANSATITKSASSSNIEDRLQPHGASIDTPIIRKSGQPTSTSLTAVSTELFRASSAGNNASKRHAEEEAVDQPPSTVQRTTGSDSFDVFQCCALWTTEHPGHPPPTWMDFCDGSMSQAARYFRRQLLSHKITLQELSTYGRLVPGQLETWLSAYSIEDLDEAMIHAMCDSALGEPPPAAEQAMVTPTTDTAGQLTSWGTATQQEPFTQATASGSSSNPVLNAPASTINQGVLPVEIAWQTLNAAHAPIQHPNPNATAAPIGLPLGQRPAFSHAMAVAPAIPILRVLDYAAITRFIDDLRKVLNLGIFVHLSQCLTQLTGPTLGIQFVSHGLIQRDELDVGPDTNPNPHCWVRTMTAERFIECLRTCYRESDAASAGYSVVERLGRLRPDFGMAPRRDLATNFISSVNNILADTTPGSYNPRAAVNALLNGIVSSQDETGKHRTVSTVNTQLHARVKAADPPITDPIGLLIEINSIIDKAATAHAEASVWSSPAVPSATNNQQGWRGGVHTQQLGAANPRPIQQQVMHALNQCDGKCYGCGRNYRGKGKRCPQCAGHPDRNTIDCPFVEAPIYAEVSARVSNGELTFPVLPLRTRANMAQLTPEQIAHMEAEYRRESADSADKPNVTQGGRGFFRGGADGRGRGSGHTGGRFGSTAGGRAYPGPGGRGSYSQSGSYGKEQGQGELVLFAANTFTENNITFPSVIITTPTVSLTVACLFDSGALQDNYVNRTLAEWLQVNGAGEVNVDGGGLDVNLAGTDYFVSSVGTVKFSVKFLNEISMEFEEIKSIKATILDSKYPLIIGRPTIRKHKIARKVLSFFEKEEDEPGEMPATPLAINPPPCTPRYLDSTGNGVVNVRGERWRQYAGDTQPSQVARNQLSLLNIVKTKEQLLPDCEPDIDYIDWPDDPFDNFFTDNTPLIEKIDIQGSLSTQRQIRKLCEQYADIFSENVRADPANVPPMEIKVDPLKWQTPRNRGPPRTQSNTKMQEIEKQIKKYLELGVIKPVAASEYSNIHMVPKSTPGEWRFCLDFVQLNAATEGSDAWPIPNIKNMLGRIGGRKSTVFGVMDMTAGYHQTPISASSQIFTAFICFIGIFCWLRVPMGLKNAASYFQRVMATVVLAGVLYVACELYIDDIFVFGKDNDEFIRNLGAVFRRLQQHKVTLNPKKCHFGLASVEYVGHVVSAQGITFSSEKRGKVLEFPLPRTQKEMQAFLGLINYFRDHVPDMSSYERPLRDLMDMSKKNMTLTWHADAEKAFYTARDLVAHCPALFFVNDNAPIIVMTDASDYGVGAYIYQIIDGKEYPIIFFSRALHGAELNWATIEKEAFAIFLTLSKFSHLLRDNKFLLRTDHKNLTYINAGSSQKVKRWGVALQEFDFDIEHVPGKDNFVADAFSRLVINNQPEKAVVPTIALLPEVFPNRISEESYAKLSKHHNSEVGHFGQEKTLKLLLNAGHTWRRMRRDIRQFIAQCPFCQKIRDTHLAIKTRPYTTASYTPMEVLNIDTIGPVATDENGNSHILVIIDCFTRWVELYAIPDTTAEAAADALLQHVGRFGAPATLRSDKGSQFVNSVITEFSKLFVTHHETTLAYSKEENAIVERANKEVMRHLRAIIFHQRVQSQWGKRQLPMVMRILNSEEKTSTGLSPAEILFGNAVDLGRHILHAPASQTENSSEPLSTYMEKLLKQQSTLIEVAQATQLKHDSHHLSTFDPAFTEFPINSYVLLEPPEGRRPKLQTRKKGPFQVVNFIGPKYVLQDLLSGKNFETHISNLSPFNYDESRTDPVDVAMQDTQEFLIEDILSHRGDRTRRSTMEFLVKWEGFKESYNSWEPYANLRDTIKLTEYLSTHRLKSLLPKP